MERRRKALYDLSCVGLLSTSRVCVAGEHGRRHPLFGMLLDFPMPLRQQRSELLGRRFRATEP